MTWPTHVMTGISSLWLLTVVPPDVLGYDLGILAACAALGALLPDLDASQSKIKHLKLPGTNLKPFFIPAQLVCAADRHRGLLHSLLGWLMVAILSLPLSVEIGGAPWLAFLLGYGSHLLADLSTKSGLMLLYPNKKRHYLLPKGWRITTGSQAEEVCFVVVAAITMLLLLSAPR